MRITLCTVVGNTARFCLCVLRPSNSCLVTISAQVVSVSVIGSGTQYSERSLYNVLDIKGIVLLPIKVHDYETKFAVQSTQQHAHAPAEEAELLSKTFKNIKTALNTIHFPIYTKYGFTLR